MLRLALILILALGLVSCADESLYSGLTEKEANEIIALLHNAGISATKSSSGEQRYTVSTSRETFSQAIELLKTNGFPKNRFESLGDVFKKEGFVSSPLEERARLNYAQSQELSRTIESIDGVILARVHLAIPKENQLDNQHKPSSASVFIKHRRGIDLSGRESQIKALIVNSIEGLPYENVTVAMFSANPVPISLKIEPDNERFLSLSAKATYLLIISLFSVVLIFGAISISLWFRSQKQAAHLKISSSE